MTIRIHIKLSQNCPYCGKPRKGRATCGDALCQWKHHIHTVRMYWDKKYRKTEQIRKTRITIIQPVVSEAPKK